MKNLQPNCEGIRDRLQAIIFEQVPEKGRFAWLEENTGIARKTWQTFWTRANATPNGEMIQAIARLFCGYAFWLATGIADEKFGHEKPNDPTAKNQRKIENTASAKLFSELLKMAEDPANIKSQDSKNLDLIFENKKHLPESIQRINVYEKIRWIDIFLNNYLLDFPIDEAISAFNFMRGVEKRVEVNASEIAETEAINALLNKFIEIKDQLEKKRDWLIENNERG